MTLSDYIAQFLYSNGVDTVFEMIGGMSVRIIDAIYRSERIKIISAHHEQGAALAACGWAKSKNIPGVAISTSGPGATNLITGIATSYFDSIPVIFITGQVNQNEISNTMEIRQLGFQETDIVSMASPITKYAVQLESASDITKILPKAFEIANSGRKGPVLLDIPMNLQKEEIHYVKGNKEAQAYSNVSLSPQSISIYEDTIDKLNLELTKSQRPLFLLGGGIVQSKTKEIMRAIVDKSKIPAVFSLHGKEILETASNFSVGLIGTYGNRWANMALYESDLLIVLGSRLDIRQTGADTESFKEGKRIIQIDIDKNEVGIRVAPEIKDCADLNEFLPPLYDRIQTHDDSHWVSHIKALKNRFIDDKELSDISGINPNYFLKQLGLIKTQHIHGYVTDVGANQIWAAQSIPIAGKQFFYTSGGMGAMGYALPVAIGAALAKIDDGKVIVAIVGDGGIQCNIQELELLHRFNLPVKLIILNNNSLGMVKQFQDEICDSRYPGTILTYGAPDFLKIAEAYNIPAITISDKFDINNGLNWLFATREPSILEVRIDVGTGIYPKMKFGHELNDMFPYL